MGSWVEQELCTLELNDARRERRLKRIVDRLASQPSLSIPRACADKAEMNATYYAWNSPHVTPEAILAAHRDATVERLSSLPVVLVATDTTNIDLTTHESVEGLGHLDNKTRFGLKVHSAVAISPEGGFLGTLHQHVWARDPQALGQFKERRKRDLSEKESQRWLDTLDAVQQVIPESTVGVLVGDREADIYGLFAHPREAHMELLVRSAWNRRTENGYLHDRVRAELPCGKLTITVPRSEKRAERTAVLTLRYAKVSILPPKNLVSKMGKQGVEVWIVLAEEETPADGVKDPVSWLLLTTLPMNNSADAAQCVAYYTRRWLIERFHYVLKSGCGVEKLQLHSIDALETALATYDVVAWRLLNLTLHARLTPEAPCSVVFEQAEWEALCVRSTKKSIPPKKPPTLHEAVRMIAKLGGFLGRKSDGEPGVKTIWQGLVALHEVVETYTAMRGIPSPRLC